MHKFERQLAEGGFDDEFTTRREEALVREAALGQDVEDFFYSQIGKFVLGAAAQDQAAIETKLTTLRPNTPWRRRTITDLQQRHAAIGMALSWLEDAIDIGKGSESELTANEGDYHDR